MILCSGKKRRGAVGRWQGRRGTIGMMKPILGMVMVLAAAGAVCAQELGNATSVGRGSENVAAPFSDTSAAQVNLFAADNNASPSFALATPGAPAADPVPAAPAAKPKFVFGDRDDYRWQLGLGVEFMRFQSGVINASAVGVNTTLSYYTNSWFALEGNVVTAFAPPVSGNDHVKYFGGGGGLRIGGRRNQWEPWGHALIGGAHLQPQTAAGNRTALMAQAGLGVDYRVNSRLSLRVEGDYVYTNFYNQNQNSFQGVAGVVFHF